MNSEYFRMDWTRLVSKLLQIIPKKLPRDCMIQGYMFASLMYEYEYKKETAKGERTKGYL